MPGPVLDRDRKPKTDAGTQTETEREREKGSKKGISQVVVTSIF